MRPWQYYLHLARRWLVIAIVPAILAGAAAYALTARQAKIYEATVVMYVQQPTNPFSTYGTGTDVQSSLQVAPTYTQMLSGNKDVLAPMVNADMRPRYPGYNLAQHTLTASQPSTALSQLVYLSITDTNPMRAAAAANTAANAFVQRITSIESAKFQKDQAEIKKQLATASANVRSISQEIATYQGNASGLSSLRSTLAAYQVTFQSLLSVSQQLRVIRDTGGNQVSVYAPATVPKSPIGPHPTRTALIAALVALIFVAAVIFAYDYADDTLRSPEEIEEVVGAPILGLVERFARSGAQKGLVTRDAPRSLAAEAYRLIRTNVEFTNVDAPRRTLLVTSALANEGKTTTASNLANVIAEGGRSVILLDADLRNPSIHRLFSLDRLANGLTNLLISSHELNGYGAHPIPNSQLVVVPSGPKPPNAADLLGSSRMRQVMEHLKTEADLIILDAPPLLPVADSTILATTVDGVVLVVDPQRTKRRELKKAREAIEAVGGRIVGVVINRLSTRGGILGQYYGYYHSPYYHQYSGPYLEQKAKETAESRA
jgi:succinoglycan biosynthesis transport protein ExoP